MSKHERDLEKNIERRKMMRAGRADEAAETVRALLRPTERTNANRLLNEENTTTLELHDSKLRWSASAEAKSIELLFASSGERDAALLLIRWLFSLDKEARRKLPERLKEKS